MYIHIYMYIYVCIHVYMYVCIYMHTYIWGFCYFKDFIYLFLEKGREGEREEQKHQYVVASHVSPTGNLACNPDVP